VWKCITTIPGDQCVMTDSVTQQPQLFAALSASRTFHIILGILCLFVFLRDNCSTWYGATENARKKDQGCSAVKREAENSGPESVEQ